PVPFDDLSAERNGEKSIEIRKRVMKAREVQTKRYQDLPTIHYNAQIGPKHLHEYCQLDEPGKNLIKNAMERLNLSSRFYDRILRVSRTIADLEESEKLQSSHIAEAIQYRSLDREGWGI